MPMTRVPACRQVEHPAGNLRRYLTPSRARCVQRNIARHASKRSVSKGLCESAARDLHTTLVLERRARDFSTDAYNSALIVNNEISADSEWSRIKKQKRNFF